MPAFWYFSTRAGVPPPYSPLPAPCSFPQPSPSRFRAARHVMQALPQKEAFERARPEKPQQSEMKSQIRGGFWAGKNLYDVRRLNGKKINNKAMLVLLRTEKAKLSGVLYAGQNNIKYIV